MSLKSLLLASTSFNELLKRLPWLLSFYFKCTAGYPRQIVKSYKKEAVLQIVSRVQNSFSLMYFIRLVLEIKQHVKCQEESSLGMDKLRTFTCKNAVQMKMLYIQKEQKDGNLERERRRALSSIFNQNTYNLRRMQKI